MAKLVFISHPEVTVDPGVPITDWGLSDTGRHRAARFANSDVLGNVTAIWTSAERKAHETGELLAAAHGLEIRIDPDLGENDRSATGFLPPREFEATADAFFATPGQSIRGWETAVDAQSRIKSAVQRAIDRHLSGDLAIVSHGAVGTLLWCALKRLPIDRRYDQPGQGHYWTADLATLLPGHGWRPMA